MGDLARDLGLEATGDGRYRTVVSKEWEMWGPLGGYLASLALQAVAQSPERQPVPVSFHCNFLAVASFDEVELHVRPLHTGRSAAAHQVTVVQHDRVILEASVWSAGSGFGPEHDVAVMPEVPGADALEANEHPEEDAGFPFSRNVRTRFVRMDLAGPDEERRPPVWQAWMQFRPQPTFIDPWIDASRSIILLDLSGWPSAVVHHHGPDAAFLAPSLDLTVQFHTTAHDSTWLLVDGAAPVSRGGILGWKSQVWSAGGSLVASGCGQSLWRPL